jgi:hypothetical protein
MKIAIIQPYFFPYIGYWQLIHAVDCFVSFDEAQYLKRGWVNKNRILNPSGGWQYRGRSETPGPNLGAVKCSCELRILPVLVTR